MEKIVEYKFNDDGNFTFDIFLGKTKLVCNKNSNYQFTIYYNSFDEGVMRVLRESDSNARLLEKIRHQIFVERMHLNSERMKYFLGKIKNSMFYLSGIYIQKDRELMSKEDHELILSSVMTFTGRDNLRLYKYFFDAQLKIKNNSLKTDDIINEIINNHWDDIDQNDPINEKIYKYKLDTLHYSKVWEKIRNDDKVGPLRFLLRPWSMLLFSVVILLGIFFLIPPKIGLYAKLWITVIGFFTLASVGLCMLSLMCSRLLGKYNFSLFLPKVNAFLLAGWLALLPVSNDLWSLNCLINPSRLTPYIILFLVLVFIIALHLFKLRQITPEYSLKNIISGLCTQSLITFPISVVIGTILLQFSFPKIVTDPSFYSYNIENYELVDRILKSNNDDPLNRIYLEEEFSKKYNSSDKITGLELLLIQLPENRFPSSMQRQIKSDFTLNDTLTINNHISDIINTLKVKNYLYVDYLLDKYAESVENEFMPPIIRLTIIPSHTINLFPRLLLAGSILSYFIGFIIQYATMSPRM